MFEMFAKFLSSAFEHASAVTRVLVEQITSRPGLADLPIKVTLSLLILNGLGYDEFFIVPFKRVEGRFYESLS